MDKKTVVGLAGICLGVVGVYVLFTYGWEHGFSPADIVGRAKDPLALVLGLIVMVVGGVLAVYFLIEPIGRKVQKEKACFVSFNRLGLKFSENGKRRMMSSLFSFVFIHVKQMFSRYGVQ